MMVVILILRRDGDILPVVRSESIVNFKMSDTFHLWPNNLTLELLVISNIIVSVQCRRPIRHY